MSASIPGCSRPLRAAWSVIPSSRLAGMMVILASPSIRGISPSSRT